jgi:hypothetical protein
MTEFSAAVLSRLFYSMPGIKAEKIERKLPTPRQAIAPILSVAILIKKLYN